MSFLERKNTKDGMAAGQKASVDNIYMLDGKVPVLNAIPFGLQHILAMFVANIAPILIVAGACGMDAKNTAMIIQSAMMIAGIGTLIQLFPIWRIGSRLPMSWEFPLPLYPLPVSLAGSMAMEQSWERFLLEVS